MASPPPVPPISIDPLRTLNDRALDVWMASNALPQPRSSPGQRRAPLNKTDQALERAARRASRAFLKALRTALAANTPGLEKALERVSEHVRSDIPALTALYAHPRGPRCDAGALSRLLNANTRHWYAPSGLGALVQTMLARGASPHHGNGHAFPLLQAVEIASPDAVEVLVAAGANPEGTELGRTDPYAHPLSLAFALGHTACVKALLAGGADPGRVHPEVAAFDSENSDGNYQQDQKIAAWKECADVLRAHQLGRRLETAWKDPHAEPSLAETVPKAPRRRM